MLHERLYIPGEFGLPLRNRRHECRRPFFVSAIDISAALDEGSHHIDSTQGGVCEQRQIKYLAHADPQAVSGRRRSS